MANIQPVIILGMHRSGTSCLTGSLEEAGLFLGDVNNRNSHSHRALNEYVDIRQLNSRILEANGGSWDSVPATADWTDEHRRIRDRLIESFPTDRPWGFKDPRTTITLEGWLEALPGARLVGTFRHPTEVVMALEKRNGYPAEKILGIWNDYNRLMLEAHDRYGFDVIQYDWPGYRYRQGLKTIAENLDLPVRNPRFTHYQPSIRRNRSSSEVGLPGETVAIFEKLCALAERSVPLTPSLRMRAVLNAIGIRTGGRASESSEDGGD